MTEHRTGALGLGEIEEMIRGLREHGGSERAVLVAVVEACLQRLEELGVERRRVLDELAGEP